MTKTQKLTAGIISLLVGAAIIFAGFKVYTKMNKDSAIKLLMAKNPNRDPKLLASFDAGFLIAWAEAAGNKTSFQYKGKMYSSETGKAI